MLNNENLANLYQELILDHSRNPLNFGELSCPPALQRVGSNPLCGDKLVVFLAMNNGKIEDIKFKGEGCSIFISACSMLSAALKGKNIEEAKEFITRFMGLITLSEDESVLGRDELDKLGKLAVFQHVRNYPARVKCAALFARTAQSLLENPDSDVTITSE